MKSFLRVFEVETEVPPSLVATGDAPGQRSRAAYLMDIFSVKAEFAHTVFDDLQSWGLGIGSDWSLRDCPGGAATCWAFTWQRSVFREGYPTSAAAHYS